MLKSIKHSKLSSLELENMPKTDSHLPNYYAHSVLLKENQNPNKIHWSLWLYPWGSPNNLVSISRFFLCVCVFKHVLTYKLLKWKSSNYDFSMKLVVKVKQST